MSTSGLCIQCAPIGGWLKGLIADTPSHCYGTGDVPAPPGVLGGFRCNCQCRNWHGATHPYWPGMTQTAGDCATCGHVKNDPIHITTGNPGGV